MAETLTFNYGWTKPDPGASANTWGATLNATIDGIDGTVKSVSNAGLTLAGGTLTGPLILNADPTVALGAATKQYVDNNYLLLSGGTLSGSLTVNGTVSVSSAIGATGPVSSSTQVWTSGPVYGQTYGLFGYGGVGSGNTGGYMNQFGANTSYIGTIQVLNGSAGRLNVESAGTTNANFTSNYNAAGGLSLRVLAQRVDGALVQFVWGTSTVIGQITTNGSTTTYGTSSDIRLKSNPREIDSATCDNMIDKIEPKFFDMVKSGRKLPKGVEIDDPPKMPLEPVGQPGFSAQDLAEVYPWAVMAGLGEPEDEGFIPWTVDYSKLVPLLLAELKHLRKRVAALEAR